jgi:branched-chain amino acid transport system ATP-binding protein
MNCLELEQVEVVYHRAITAIQAVTLNVPERGIVALLGTNGSGKTTTLRAISGFLGGDDARVTGGRIRYYGRVVNGMLPHETCRAGIVLVPERDKIFETLTVRENLAALRSGSAGDRAPITLDRVFEYFPILAERRRQLAGYLSGGERQMLAVASALLCQPRVLLIDELSFGLAPVTAEALFARVRRLRDDLGLAILLVEQNAGAALEIADAGYVMEHGRIVFHGTAGELVAHADVQEFYLGVGADDARKSYSAVKQYRRRRRWF